MKNFLLLFTLVAVVVAPIIFRGKHDAPADATQTVVIVTPHNESIRYEFGRAFAAHYFAETGQRVAVDFRTPGGTSEITRYTASEFVASFRDYWTRTLGRDWSSNIERGFSNAKLPLPAAPADDTPEQAARRAFLASDVGCGIDLFFGGGAYDFQSQASAGYLVDSGFIAANPEIFNDAMIPQSVSGEPFWDPQGRWIGTVVSSFGICSNTDALHRVGIAAPPAHWSDLADPRYLGEIALANPTQSSSVNKAFEMLIQQQMQEAQHDAVILENSATTALPKLRAEAEARQIRDGWTRAMQLLMKIGANARYFTDASTKIALDVGSGEAAAGMSIDFYARFQAESMHRPDGTSPMIYENAIGGTSVGVDPIGLFRGAPHPEVARAFIAFVLSPEGQRLWNWKPGTPGGPEHYALRRLPILPTLYADDFASLRSDPGVNPYELARTFTYHEKWTGPLFRPIAFIFRVMCIDTHDELADSWRALAAAHFPPDAMAVFTDVSAVDYDAASGPIKDALSGKKITEVQLAKQLADRFRAQYRRAATLARQGQ